MCCNSAKTSFRKNKWFIPIFYKRWLEIIGTHQLLVYTDDVYKLGGSVRTIKWTTASVFASKEIGLEVNTDKTNYMVISWDQNAGWIRSINPLKVWNSSYIWEQS